jgi:putative PIN family toxin of toxin-antitoxin system
MKLRVVFDASSLIGAAIRPGSVPDQALQIALGSCELCASMETIEELKEVLQRKRFDRYSNFSDRMEFVRVIQAQVTNIAVTRIELDLAAGLCRDVKDEKFLALCLAAGADALVSSDHDLLILNPWNGIPILTPAEFLAEAEGSDSRGGDPS